MVLSRLHYKDGCNAHANVKNLKKILIYRTKSPMILKLGIEDYMYVLKLFKAYINDNHELALTYFMIMSLQN